MGRIFEYVVLIGNLSLIFGLLQHKDVSPPGNYHGEKQPNYTPPSINHNFPNDGNDSVNRREMGDPLPPSYNRKRTQSQQQQHLNVNKGSNSVSQTPGLSAYLSEPSVTSLKRSFSVSKNGYRNSRPNRETPWRNFIPPISQEIIPGKNNKKNFPNHFFEKNNSLRQKNLSPAPNHLKNNSFTHQNILAQSSQNQNSYRRYQQHGARNPRFYHSPHYSSACDPCNSAPWMPVLNVPNYYRKERNHKFEVNKPGSNDFHYDYHALSSDSHDFLLPSSPLVPPTPAVLDGTISSSFGLPVGNIPTGHGLLAPIAHFVSKFNDYGAQNSDYSNSLTYFTPQTLLNSSPIPELSPVPIVPIYDSNQFYSGQLYDSSDIGLVPPTASPLSVSNVVFTIAEGSSSNVDSYNHLNLDSNKIHTDSLKSGNWNFKPNAQVNSHAISAGQKKPSVPIQGIEGIDIVKSIPIAEFSTSSSESHQTLGNGHYNAQNTAFSNVHHEQAEQSTVLQSNPSNYLIPPEAFFNSSDSKVPGFYNSQKQEESQYQAPFEMHSSVPKPLVDPSSSWLFLDSHSQPKNPDSPSHSIMAESQDFANIINDKFGPGPAANAQDTDKSKSKKIQIIIPYTTKDKNDLDSKSQESIRHEVFKSPQSLPNQSESRHTLRPEVTTILSTSSAGEDNQSSEETNKNRESLTHETINFKNDKNNLEVNRNKSAKKYLTEMQHVLAKNIKELLMREIEKTQNNQNFPLQNNIDNWTALEYSNHKTFGIKEPKKIITQTYSVTSVPGTSASHVLLPSKKIPDEYFVTTPSPIFDDTLTTLLKVSNISIHSRPFTTRPYSTATAYSPSNVNALTTTQPPTTQKKDDDTNGDSSNYETNYTVLGSSRVNYWGKLNENLGFSEIKNSTKGYDETTIETSWSPSSAKTEKVQIVTPVPTKRKSSEFLRTSRRTTRHARPTERTIFKKIPTRQNQKSGANGIRTNFFKMVNSTKLVKISNSSFESEKAAFKNKNSSEPGKNLTFVASNEKAKTVQEETSVGDKIVYPLLSTLLRNVSSEEVNRPVKTDKSEELSINDIIPFRNKQLPWESKVNDSQQNVGRQRKSLIKQVKLRRPRSLAAHPLWPLSTENSKSGTVSKIIQTLI